MRLKNEQEIDVLASEYTLSSPEGVTQYGIEMLAYIKGYTQAQQDILASASEGFEEWLTNYFSLEGSTDIEEDVNMQSIEYDELKEAWQAAILSQSK